MEGEDCQVMMVLLFILGFLFFILWWARFRIPDEVIAIRKRRLQRRYWEETRFPSGEEYADAEPEGEQLFKESALGEFIIVHTNGIGALWRSVIEPSKKTLARNPGCHVTGARKWRFVPYEHIYAIFPIGVTYEIGKGHKQFTRAFQIETKDNIVALALFEEDPERRMTEFRKAIGPYWSALYDSSDVLSGAIQIRRMGDDLSWYLFGDVFKPTIDREASS